MSDFAHSHFDNAIFVLANLMDRYGQLNDDSKARLELAVGLVRDIPSACLITSGWNYRADSEIMIADAMANYAQKKYGIAPHRIVRDICARDTVGDAVFVKRNIIEHSDIREITIVSSSYHLPRVQEIFEFVFFQKYRLQFIGTQFDHAQGRQESEAASLDAFRSTFAGIPPGNTEMIYKRLISDHPLYNGKNNPAFMATVKR